MLERITKELSDLKYQMDKSQIEKDEEICYMIKSIKELSDLTKDKKDLDKRIDFVNRFIPGIKEKIEKEVQDNPGEDQQTIKKTVLSNLSVKWINKESYKCKRYIDYIRKTTKNPGFTFESRFKNK